MDGHVSTRAVGCDMSGMDGGDEAVVGKGTTRARSRKNKVNNMTATLKTPTKPKGKEWSDFEAWWNQLSYTEKVEALRDPMTAFRGRLRRVEV